jgi:nucleoid-associated protein YgaU
MSTLEKFGILVILVLVVIIGVVAVWGVGGGEASPFDQALPNGPAAPDAAPEAVLPTWPNPAVAAAPEESGTGSVPPPPVGSAPTAPSSLNAPPAAPSTGMKYRIKRGDTLAGIAAATLGSGNRWKDIVAANPGLDPRRLKIDQEIMIPNSTGTSVAQRLPAPAPAPAPAKAPVKSFQAPNPDDGASGPEVAGTASSPSYREVEVRSGDTLIEISRRELGNPDLYHRILKANPGLDPKRMKVGQKIRIPLDG